MTEGKAQWLRLADVLVLGPFMIYSARKVRHRYFRAGLTAIGIGTIAYSGFAWLRAREEQKAAAAAGEQLGYYPGDRGVSGCGCGGASRAVARAHGRAGVAR